MSRREDPCLRQHRSRLMQLVEVTNIRPGRGNGKRRSQRSTAHGSSPSNGGTSGGNGGNSRVTMQDIVRSDPGYTPNIEHLVFPERKNSNPNLVPDDPSTSAKTSAQTASGMLRLAEVFARHYTRGSSQDSSITSRKNHVNSQSVDGNVTGSRQSTGSSGNSAQNSNRGTGSNRRWLSQNSQSQQPSQPTRQHSAEDGGRGGNGGPAATVPRRLSPAVDPVLDHSNSGTTASRSERGPNISVLHLRGNSEPWETSNSIQSGAPSAFSYSGSAKVNSKVASKNKSGAPNNNGSRHSYTRGSTIPGLSRQDGGLNSSSNSGKQRSQDGAHPRERRRENSFLAGSGGTSGELFASGNCSRELSPVRWCDREVDGVYLGRSGWVQVQQRSLDENRKANYESNLVTTSTGTLPLPRRAAIKLADYHCSNSEPGNCQDFTSSRPDFLALHGQEYESPLACTSPHKIPESFSPPSITPIISPPPAFQDAAKKTSKHVFGKQKPFLPRSNAIVDSDLNSPPVSPPANLVNWNSLPSPTRSSQWSRRGPTTSSPVATTPQQNYRLSTAKSLEDQTPTRRTQFVQRYKDSSSSSSSSMGFRSLDSCVNRVTMPRLAENTDSSIEGYEDGDEDDNPSSSLNLSAMSSTVMNSSPESSREKISPSSRSGRNSHHRGQIRRSPASADSGKQLSFNSPTSSSSSSTDRQGRSPTPNPFRRNNATRQHQSARNAPSSPDSLQTRVRRSRSLQLPEKKSPGSVGPMPMTREHSRDNNDPHRVVVKIGSDRSNDRTKRHVLQNRMAQSTDSALNEELLREAEVVTEFLYGTRSRPTTRSLMANRYDRRDEGQDQRRTTGSYDVYFVPPTQQQQQQLSQVKSNVSTQSQQQNRRPRTLQRGGSTPVSVPPLQSNSSPLPRGEFCPSPETKSRCTNSTCNFWPHCSSRDAVYAPGPNSVFPGNMKMSQSYPAHQRLTPETQPRATGKNGNASSSPASLEQVDDPRDREKQYHRDAREPMSSGKYRTRQSRRSPMDGSVGFMGSNGNASGTSHRDQYHRNEGSFETTMNPPSSAMASRQPASRSPSGVGGSSNSSSSSDIWVTTSDRTVTKSPRNAKSSGASTPMEDATIGSLKTLAEPQQDPTLSRPGSAPAQREDSLSTDVSLDSQQRSLSLPKSFLAHNVLGSNSSNAGSTPWHRGFDSQRSTPSPNRLCPQEPAPPHTAPVSPLHESQLTGHGLKERRRGSTLSKAQRRAKASSTPALLDRDQDGRQWSADEDDRGNIGRSATEHPVVEANIPLVAHARLQEVNSPSSGGTGSSGSQVIQRQNQQSQESVLQKFRKSFSLRFHKKGSKESSEGGDGPLGDANTLPLDEDDDSEPPPPPAPQQSQTSIQHKDDPTNDQKFRFGPLVWRTSKERKKNSKAARNAKCNSGDSGIQIEMVSVGGLTGGSGGCGEMAGGCDSSESHDTDAPDETDSPPALRRRVTDKSRPQSELINQILIDKFKADLQTRANRHHHVRRTNSDLGGQRLLQWDTRSGYSHAHNYRRMLSTPSPIKTRPPRQSPRHSPNDMVTLRSNAKGRSARTNLRRSLSQPLGINQHSPLMRTRTAGATRLSGGNVLSEDEHDARGGGGTSDEDMMSDSESSVASLSERKKAFEPTLDDDVGMTILAEAVWDHVAMDSIELAFRAGDVIEILDVKNRDWWWGCCGDKDGWFPSASVRLRVSQEDTVEDCLAAMASGTSTNGQLRRRTSISLLSNEQVRSSVVRELVQTERDFVKVLRDVAEGYIAECRGRTEMFTDEQIDTIFINLEQLLSFQSEFLKELESVVDWSAPYKSCVGECFLNHRAGFRMYSEYCNSHPMAIATLQELYQHNRYNKFFEGCRLMRGLIEIPLDGYLLTPIQRICKYPLQLAELLKYTKADHPDFHKIQEALEAMRGVAVLINERKRRMESLEKLAAWQLRVEGWEGEDLIDSSSQLIYQGDAIRVTTGMWTNNITLFLFDHQLVYCKKDILKRNTYVYKDRICLDTSEVIDIPNGKDSQLGVTVRHCIKVYCRLRHKCLLFCCRTDEEKRQWLAAMNEERRLVRQDRNDGLEFPLAAKQLAKIAATHERRGPPVKPRDKTYKRNSAFEESIITGQGTTNSLGRKVGTWFTFGSSKKGTRRQTS